jgi:hypothetical protein
VNDPACKGSPETALPGTSQHERGLAVDFGGDLGAVALLAPTYHLKATVPAEPWHYEPDTNASDAEAVAALNASPIDAGMNAVGSVADAAGGVVAALAKLADPRLWLRIVMVLAGAGLALAGLVLLGYDLTPGTGRQAGAIAATSEALA